jgi:hypothetical protein
MSTVAIGSCGCKITRAGGSISVTRRARVYNTAVTISRLIVYMMVPSESYNGWNKRILKLEV